MLKKYKKIKIAFIGNPNCGKTTIFNTLTGRRHKIANYPGVTVEIKKSIVKTKKHVFEMIDLPGIYSLYATGEDEKIALDFLLNEDIDVIVNVLDASNLEKSLFLTTQLLELGKSCILAFNMSDIAEKKKQKIDTNFLKKILEVEIVPLIASKKKGINELLEKVKQVTNKNEPNGVNVKFDDVIECELEKIEKNILKKDEKHKKRFISIKLLEEDEKLLKKIANCKIIDQIKKSKSFLENYYKDHLEVVLSNKRRDFIASLLSKAIEYPKEKKKSISDKLDELLLHKFFGLPIFLAIMFFIFFLTFFIGSYPMNWIQKFFSFLSYELASIWPTSSFLLLKSLIIKGIFAGVGSVISFLPNIAILFFFISLLEDTGYMTRAAFILDRLMHKIGLHGKCFIPMLIGFGCSVPAILATRYIESKKDRIITILTLPLIACSAKLVVFTLLIPIFFKGIFMPIVLLSLYLIGILLGILLIKIFQKAFSKLESFSFVMELPEYQAPSIKTSLMHMWDRSKEYLIKAGSLIFAFSIIIWALSAFPLNQSDISQSYLGKVGSFIEPAFRPLGFDWKVDTAIVASVASKEVFVSQLSIIYAIKEGSSIENLKTYMHLDYSALQGFCILLFILISSPCIATIAVTRKETSSWKLASFQFLYLGALAYIVTFLVYNLGLIFKGFYG